MAQPHKVKRRLYFALSLNVPFILFTLSVFTSSVYLHESHDSAPTTIEIRGNYTETMNFLHYPIYAASSVSWSERGVIAKVDLETDGLGLCNANVPHLLFEASFYDENTLRISMRDADTERWEPERIPSQRKYWFNNYILDLEEYPFAFRVVRKQGETIVFDSRGRNSSPTLCFTDKYIEFSTKMNANTNVFGLGERISQFGLRTDNRNYTIWPNSQNRPTDFGIETKGLYGHHPFYLEMVHDKAHGVFFHNFNALQVDFISEKVTFRATGGIIDLFLFLGSEPESVLQQYHSIIGKPSLPPYWALGYHQTSRGAGLASLRDMVKKHRENNIPLDAVWLDIDYMSKSESFSIDTEVYPLSDLQAFVSELKANNVHIVSELMPGVKKTAGRNYAQGVDANVFLESGYISGEPLVLHTLTQNVSFVDFFHPNSTTYWCEMLHDFKSQIDFDGLWLENNEVTVDPTQTAPPYAETSYELPFVPENVSLDYNMLPLRLEHYGGSLRTEFNVHSLYGSMEAKVSGECLTRETGMRPLIVSRSTKSGDGKYAGHTLGDNFSSWEHMRLSISSLLNFQLFGVPLSGANVCGSEDSVTEELCTRWMQLAAWYPLLRNHNSRAAAPQEVYTWSHETMESMKQTLLLRYSLVTYIYSLFFSVGIKGGSVIRPLFFEFPKEESFVHDDAHLLIGSALFFTPVMSEGVHESVMSLPTNSIWYNYFTGERIVGRENIRFFTAIDAVSLLVRSGTIITYQNSTSATTVDDMRNRPVSLMLALDEQRQAKGEIYMDDGSSPDTIKTKQYAHISFRAFKEEFSLVIEIQPRYLGYAPKTRVTEVKVYGLHLRVVEEVTISSTQVSDLTRVHTFSYSEAKGMLVISLDLDIAAVHRIRVS